jgi:hypothetical protein
MMDFQSIALTEHQPPDVREGRCPSCGQYTTFHFLGEQRWPARLVEATGCAPVSLLWTCESCHTTITDTDIEG